MKKRVFITMALLLLLIAAGDVFLVSSAKADKTADTTPVLACKTAALKTQIVYDSARDDGLTKYNVVGTNQTTTACSVKGTATIGFYDANNVKLPIVDNGAGAVSASYTLQPGESVSAVLSTFISKDAPGNKDGACTDGIVNYHISAPGDDRYRSQKSPFTTSCGGVTLSGFSR